MPPGITGAYLTSKTWGPQPRSNRGGIHMGLILHTPWQMQMGTYETWGISLTDRAASNKNVGCIAHWLTNEILNQCSEPGGTALQATFQVHFRQTERNPNQIAIKTAQMDHNHLRFFQAHEIYTALQSRKRERLRQEGGSESERYRSSAWRAACLTDGYYSVSSMPKRDENLHLQSDSEGWPVSS